jgi:hypothetical protein
MNFDMDFEFDMPDIGHARHGNEHGYGDRER